MIENFSKTELENEKWKDIDGYDGAYQVSDLGRVRSNKSGEWKVRRASKDKDGYLQVALCKDGNEKNYKVHRLVAQAFIENDDETKIYINHRNECKSDNRLWNLEYCTPQYNSTYNNIHLRRKPHIQSNYKQNKIRHIYQPDLTISENLEIFRANGIECSKSTVVRLRKDLKLNGSRPNYIRDKVKDIYNPNLTYAQNLEIFRANGIEYSKRVIQSIRQDLGLTKKYNRNQ